MTGQFLLPHNTAGKTEVLCVFKSYADAREKLLDHMVTTPPPPKWNAVTSIHKHLTFANSLKALLALFWPIY